MNYNFVRDELYQFVYNNKQINLSQKQKGMGYLLIGVYKKQILEYISLKISIEEIKEKFLKEIVILIRK
jgi:hypothetical protein